MEGLHRSEKTGSRRILTPRKPGFSGGYSSRKHAWPRNVTLTKQSFCGTSPAPKSGFIVGTCCLAEFSNSTAEGALACTLYIIDAISETPCYSEDRDFSAQRALRISGLCNAPLTTSLKLGQGLTNFVPSVLAQWLGLALGSLEFSSSLVTVVASANPVPALAARVPTGLLRRSRTNRCIISSRRRCGAEGAEGDGPLQCALHKSAHRKRNKYGSKRDLMAMSIRSR